MSIGILYESKEWSSTALRDYIIDLGVAADLIDLEKEVDFQRLLKHKLIVNRVFASAQFRGHQKSLEAVKLILKKIEQAGIRLINSREAHFYETSKYRTAKKLEELDISSPPIYCYLSTQQEPEYPNIRYPCVLKPDCGGRTNFTYILENEQELRQTLKKLKDSPFDFIVQQYISTVKGFTTRIEIIGGRCHSVLKRYVVEGGLSAYNLGSAYDHYSDCSPEIIRKALKAMRSLNIEMGSLDIIENGSDFYIIDVNSVSNFAPENIAMFDFNLIKDMAEYIVSEYLALD